AHRVGVAGAEVPVVVAPRPAAELVAPLVGESLADGRRRAVRRGVVAGLVVRVPPLAAPRRRVGEARPPPADPRARRLLVVVVPAPAASAAVVPSPARAPQPARAPDRREVVRHAPPPPAEEDLYRGSFMADRVAAMAEPGVPP
ncbi:hypothetical protein THAOC_18177, partial [Thalassiosira oceanica]